MLKNYNYMLTILLYPFLLIISYLKLANLIKGDLYTYLIIAMLIIFIPSFIMSLYGVSEDILNSKKKWRIILLILLSIFYLPIYYTKYIAKEEKYLGYILFIIAIPLTIITTNKINNKISGFFDNIYRHHVSINENYVYLSKDNVFSIDVDESFRCNKNNIGDYVLTCDRLEDDSFIGIYSYDVSNENEDDVKDKIDFHVEQTIEYIKENGYSYELSNTGEYAKIDYANNTILISQNVFILSDKEYCLIVLKEMPSEYYDYEEYEKMIDSIRFLTYNDGVSS